MALSKAVKVSKGTTPMTVHPHKCKCSVCRSGGESTIATQEQHQIMAFPEFAPLPMHTSERERWNVLKLQPMYAPYAPYEPYEQEDASG